MSMIYMVASQAQGGGGSARFPAGRAAGFANARVADESIPAEGISDARMERIMRLKAAVEDGRYFVSSVDLAECLMASMLADGWLKVQ